LYFKFSYASTSNNYRYYAFSVRGVASSIPSTKLTLPTSDGTLALTSDLDTKVDKETGKGLSTNDYTTAEKTKLAGIAEEANKYTHPSYTSATSGLYKVTVDSTGHVSKVTNVTKSDITNLGIPA
jgi:hypothetical protein